MMFRIACIAVLATLLGPFLGPLSLHGALAQKLVDPDKVAPEFREAAIKRRAEQIKQMDCAHKADEEKVLARDRTAMIRQCIDEK